MRYWRATTKPSLTRDRRSGSAAAPLPGQDQHQREDQEGDGVGGERQSVAVRREHDDDGQRRRQCAAQVIGDCVHHEGRTYVLGGHQPPYGDVPRGQRKGEGQPAEQRTADERPFGQDVTELRRRERGGDRGRHNLSQEQRLPAADPVG